jgi:hypothetical protein
MLLLEWLGSFWLVVLAATFGLVPGIAVRALTAHSRLFPVQPYLILAALAVEYYLCDSLRFSFGPMGGVLLAALMGGTLWGWWRSRLAWDETAIDEEPEPVLNADVLEAFCFAAGRLKA